MEASHVEARQLTFEHQMLGEWFYFLEPLAVFTIVIIKLWKERWVTACRTFSTASRGQVLPEFQLLS